MASCSPVSGGPLAMGLRDAGAAGGHFDFPQCFRQHYNVGDTVRNLKWRLASPGQISVLVYPTGAESCRNSQTLKQPLSPVSDFYHVMS